MNTASPFYVHGSVHLIYIYIYIYIYICVCVCVCVCVQRDATMRTIYSLFHCKITLNVSGAFTPIIRSKGNCSRRPLVQVICRDRMEGAASIPLKTIHN
jgi:hypothetical protein